jgi:YVTN family beta-propeller protein
MTVTRKNSACLVASLLVAFTLTGCRPHDFPTYPANYREYAYVTNGGSGTVSIYDVVNVRLDRELPTGANPVAVAASPTRNEVYVVNSGPANADGWLSVIDAQKNAVIGSIALHHQPVSIDISADGATAYIANQGSNSVSVIDLAGRREVARIGAGEQPAVARLSPDGKTLVVANRGGNSVSLIDPASRAVRAVFAGCPGAADAVILPNSDKTFIACSGGHQVMAVALAHAAKAATQSAPAVAAGPDRLESLLDVGRSPVHLALKPDGGEIFTSNLGSDSVSEIYNSTDEVGDTFMIGDGPSRGLVSADNSAIYVANSRSQYVTIYGIDDGKRLGSVKVGDGPMALAFSNSGFLLFAVDQRSGDVAVIRTKIRALFTMLPTGKDPNAIAVKSFTVQ